METGKYLAPSAPRRWMIWSAARGRNRTSANNNSCDCATGSSNARPANFSPRNSRAPLAASFCAASIFAIKSSRSSGIPNCWRADGEVPWRRRLGGGVLAAQSESKLPRQVPLSSTRGTRCLRLGRHRPRAASTGCVHRCRSCRAPDNCSARKRGGDRQQMLLNHAKETVDAWKEAVDKVKQGADSKVLVDLGENPVRPNFEENLRAAKEKYEAIRNPNYGME